jgi:hypothetical protein
MREVLADRFCFRREVSTCTAFLLEVLADQFYFSREVFADQFYFRREVLADQFYFRREVLADQFYFMREVLAVRFCFRREVSTCTAFLLEIILSLHMDNNGISNKEIIPSFALMSLIVFFSPYYSWKVMCQALALW